MTKKEIIENGYIDKYLLGLTTEEESSEVERLAILYPEIQQEINTARNTICSKFNRNLTEPALRSSFLTKRRVMMWSGIVVSFFCLGFFILCQEHFSLKQDYTIQSRRLAQEQDKVSKLVSFNKMASEDAEFLNALGTRRIRLKGCDKTPEAEVMVFRSVYSGIMKLRVIDLPELPEGTKYQVWAHRTGDDDLLIGELLSPVRFDGLYNLEPVRQFSALQITS
ncbi:MAG: hypothetical protein ABIQ11_04855, partial [Saprospiraceae bacterium]